MTQKMNLYIKKHRLVILVLCFFLAGLPSGKAQCSICTRTAQQLGERPAEALNKGIVYLAFTPLAIFGIIGYRWWRSEQTEEESA
ncbi:MAG TPA: hypothetical protein VGM30_11005 [Puia sp.]|jgi:hypothetical protein